MKIAVNTSSQVSPCFGVVLTFEFESVDDGVRSVNEDWRRKIDDLFRSELDSIGKAYLTVTGSPMQRVDQILNFIK